MPALAVQALALFAFIPLVLFLYLRQPLGPFWSIVTGLALMFGHRFLAAPWAARHSTERCGWCGRSSPRPRHRIEVRTAGGAWNVAACSEAHGMSAVRFFACLDRFRIPIGLGIFIPLALLIVGSLAAAAGRPFIPAALAALQFRVVVALTVIAASIGYLAVRLPDPPVRCPFPLHNLLLLGVRNTLWVFRVVGAWWLAGWLL
jgi:hypothetical protein